MELFDQVQQYLDPDTREQYAQGHLDNRVEQVSASWFRTFIRIYLQI